MISFYLAHPILSRKDVREWEEKAEQELGVELVNPFYDADNGERDDIRRIDRGEIKVFSRTLDFQPLVEGDLSLIDQCTALLAVVTGELSVGTWMEMFYARDNLLPVFVVCLDRELRTHPWIRYCVTEGGLFLSFGDFEKYWKGRQGANPGLQVGLVGRSRSGKDTVGQYLLQRYHFKRFGFADEVKILARRVFGFSREQIEAKPPEVRKVLQLFASEYARGVYPSIWRDLLLRRIARYLSVAPSDYRSVVVTDVRFVNEAEALKQAGFSVVGVSRSTLADDSHVSERELARISLDAALVNDGTIEQLHSQVDQLLVKLEVAKLEGSK